VDEMGRLKTGEQRRTRLYFRLETTKQASGYIRMRIVSGIRSSVLRDEQKSFALFQGTSRHMYSCVGDTHNL
jgi:hypothetical protein